MHAHAITALALTSPLLGLSLWTGPIHVEYGDHAFDCNGRRDHVAYPDGEFIVSSQYAPHVGLTSEVATAFVPSECLLVGVGWFGYYWPLPATPLEMFRFRLYADGAGSPGTLLHTWDSPVYEETVGSPFIYCAGLPEPITLIVGTRYWVSVVAPGDLDMQWGLVGGYDATGQNGSGIGAAVRSSTFGLPDWTPLEDALPCTACGIGLVTFVEEDCDETPTRSASWGRIKSLRR
jgi:hypothetical protein